MIRLKIERVDNNNYFLKTIENNYYKLNIEFYDLIKKPDVNDYIILNEELLNEQCTTLRFGSIHSKYGRKIEKVSETDLIFLLINNNLINLKRWYG